MEKRKSPFLVRKSPDLLGAAVYPVCSRDPSWVRVWVHDWVQLGPPVRGSPCKCQARRPEQASRADPHEGSCAAQDQEPGAVIR
jgi:hypothetical protein